ncbi:protein FAR1-RELATED SEQUENCE 5-like isoform X2 [Carex rostrata]
MVIDGKAEENIEPQVGMEFASEKHVYNFYNTYGYITGFSIRKQSRYINTKGIKMNLRMVCSKEGKSRKKRKQMEETIGGLIEKTPEKERSMQRSECKAYCQFRMHKDGVWRITSLHKDHNHQLVPNTPSKKRHLKSHKYISMENRTRIELLSQQNISANQMREIIADESGGKENLHFSKKDVNNHITRVKKRLAGVDVNAMLDFFRRRQQIDADFFFEVEPDEDNVAKNIFWVDGRSRRAYLEFGDVIIFDTTYNTNKYRMPFAPFVGVNHHQQSVFFGCALVRDEKKTTFGWLFKTWLRVMGGKKPKTIFTDQDPAMKAAIEVVFRGDTVHRVCIWHVLRKARDHLGVLYGNIEGFRDEFIAVIDFSWTIADFETNWHATLKKYKMDENCHLELMFKKRDEWAPAYFRESFCAGMSTTQRSESMNAATKIWFGANTSLYDFATRFQKMVERVYERESDEDFRTMNEIPPLLSGDAVEVEARKVYTRSIWKLLKGKITKTIALQVREVEREKLYEVRPAILKSNKYGWFKPNRMVRINLANAKADCECKGFSYQGVLCSHALLVMRHVGMEPFLPKHYILNRWTPDANANAKKACEHLDDLIEVLKGGVHGEDDEDEPKLKVVKKEDDMKFSDPPVSQCKGSRKPTRFKAPADVRDAKKMRTCSYCHKKEGHNMRKCPKKEEDEKASKGEETISIQDDKRKRREPISVQDASEDESEFMSEDDEDDVHGEDQSGSESDAIYGDEEDLF